MVKFIRVTLGAILQIRIFFFGIEASVAKAQPLFSQSFQGDRDLGQAPGYF